MNENARGPIRVLYLHHYGVIGGASRSLLELITGFEEGTVEPHMVIPNGTVVPVLEESSIPYTIVFGGISKFDHTRASYYRGLRWIVLLREIIYAFPTLYVFLKNKRKFREFDIVHINEITCLLPLYLAKKILRRPVVIHARAVANTDPKKWRTKMLNNVLDKYAERIIAIDETVAESIALPKKKRVVHNSFKIQSVLGNIGEGFSNKLAAIKKRRLNLGFIGAIHANKGIFDLLEAMVICKRNDLDVSLIIAGNGNVINKKYINFMYDLLGVAHDGNERMGKFIKTEGLEDHVHPIGFSTNTAAFFEYIDVICFPSYYNATGRPVFEAAFFQKPSIVAIKNPLSDTFIDGETGISVNQKEPQSIYGAIKQLYNNPQKIYLLGKNALTLANQNFTVKSNSNKVLNIYKDVLSSK